MILRNAALATAKLDQAARSYPAGLASHCSEVADVRAEAKIHDLLVGVHDLLGPNLASGIEAEARQHEVTDWGRQMTKDTLMETDTFD